MSWHTHSIAELGQGLARGDFCSAELTDCFLQRIRELNPHYNALVTITEELALEQAQLADRRRAAGESGALLGIPIVHKDIFCTRGVRTTCSSRMLENFMPPYNATVVERLAAAGAVMLGKANMDEFAMGSSNENSIHGPVHNPWDLQTAPGGSSGGSAAAVAGRLCAAATATDTGGSIRQPAALCGVTGLKPSYGRVSRHGMIAFASSLDQAGPIARSAEDAALLLNVMSGFDARDSTSVDLEAEDFYAALQAPPPTLRIGVVREWMEEGTASATRAEEAVRVLEGLGHRVLRLSLPRAALGLAAYYVIASAECSSNLARYDGVRYGYRSATVADPDVETLFVNSRSEGFGIETQRRILLGAYVLSSGYYEAYYRKAQQLRRLIRDEFDAAFREADVLLGATSAGAAFPLGAKLDDPVRMYREDLFTIPASLAGLPALSVPAGFEQQKPLGVQLVAPYFQEARLLALAHQFQEHSDWHLRAPPEPGPD